MVFSGPGDRPAVHLWVIYPGDQAYPVEGRITVPPLREVARLREELP